MNASCLSKMNMHCNFLSRDSLMRIMLQNVAVYCSVLECAGVAAVYWIVLECVAVYWGVLQCSGVCCSVSRLTHAYDMAQQCVAVCCSVLQCHWSVLQRVAACCNSLMRMT